MKVDVITDNAFDALEGYSRNAVCIRAATAFWTIPASELPQTFFEGLKKNRSFLCVDLNRPTSINALDSIKREDVDLCLYLVRSTGKTEVNDSVGMPNHLLHSKIIIFDYLDSDSVVWVGSHNGTFRALFSHNYECTLAIHVARESSAYKNAEKHLIDIKKACTAFNPKKLELYRFLQNGKLENTIDVLELENQSNQPLSVGQEITIFNIKERESKILRSFKQVLYTSLHGSEELLYKTTIIQVGSTPVLGTQSFGPRRHADRYLDKFPLLLTNTDVSDNMFRPSTSFVVLKIESHVDSKYKLLEAPSGSGWTSVPDIMLSEITRPKENSIYCSIQKKYKIKGLSYVVPTYKDVGLEEIFFNAEADKSAFKVLEINEKRSYLKRPLISKKILSI